MKMSCLFSVAGALVLAIGLSGVFAEEPTTLQKKAIESFAGARDQRAKLLPEIQQLKAEIEDLQHQKENVSSRAFRKFMTS
jgi:cell division protein FtsB